MCWKPFFIQHVSPGSSPNDSPYFLFTFFLFLFNFFFSLNRRFLIRQVFLQFVRSFSLPHLPPRFLSHSLSLRLAIMETDWAFCPLCRQLPHASREEIWILCSLLVGFQAESRESEAMMREKIISPSAIFVWTTLSTSRDFVSICARILMSDIAWRRMLKRIYEFIYNREASNILQA